MSMFDAQTIIEINLYIVCEDVVSVKDSSS